MKISFLITFFFCPFNYTENCWCMIETSSDLLGSSSAIFGNFRKCAPGIRNNFRKFGNLKWLKIFGNSLKTSSLVLLVDIEFLASVELEIFS